MKAPDQLYTPQTLFTFGGCVVAVYMIAFVVNDVTGLPAKYVALGSSLVMALLGVLRVRRRTWEQWPVAVVNGLLIYLSAIGINTLAASAAAPLASATPTATPTRTPQTEPAVANGTTPPLTAAPTPAAGSPPPTATPTGTPTALPTPTATPAPLVPQQGPLKPWFP